MRKWLVSTVAAAAVLAANSALAAEKLKIGVLATLEGTYTVLGEDGIRGFTEHRLAYEHRRKPNERRHSNLKVGYQGYSGLLRSQFRNEAMSAWLTATVAA